VKNPVSKLAFQIQLAPLLNGRAAMVGLILMFLIEGTANHGLFVPL
jgi:hypothetical protein